MVRSQGRERRSRITLPETFEEGTKDEPRLQALVGEPPLTVRSRPSFLLEGKPRLTGTGAGRDAGPGTQEATNGVRSAPVVACGPTVDHVVLGAQEKGSDVVTRTPPISPASQVERPDPRVSR